MGIFSKSSKRATDEHRFTPISRTERLRRQLLDPLFKVYNHLGYGFLHRVYQRALQVELLRRGFSGDLEKRMTICGRYKVEYERVIF